MIRRPFHARGPGAAVLVLGAAIALAAAVRPAAGSQRESVPPPFAGPTVAV